MIKTWIGQRPKAICFPTKSQALKVCQPHQSPQKVAFRFECVWCIFDSSENILTEDGPIKTTTVYCGKPLLGRDDSYQIGLDYNTDAIAFRNALDERAIAKAKGGQS